MREKKLLVPILIGIIAVLAVLVLYAFVVRPAINGYAVASYNQGVSSAIGAVVSQIQSKGYAQIPLANNQSLILVPYQPSNSTVSTVG